MGMFFSKNKKVDNNKTSSKIIDPPKKLPPQIVIYGDIDE
jgi:hypothetical protein